MTDLQSTGTIEFEPGVLTEEIKRTLHGQCYGMKSPENTIVILRADDSQNQRHGGIRQYRSFEAYVNAVKVETWRDDSPAHNYDSDKHLDRRIDEWGKLWSKALGCPVLRGEFRNRVKLIREYRRR
jgi:hypothetical protein